MTPIKAIYPAFLSKLTEDEWTNWLREEVDYDHYILLQGALPQFKFPKVDLSLVEGEDGELYFSGDLSNREIQIIASYMKCEWLNRTILTWENLKPLYDERDFSPAKMLSELNNLLREETKAAERLESKYYRIDNNKPFDYTTFAGDTLG